MKKWANSDGRVVCVNITDVKNYPESSCHLKLGDHPFVRKPSVVMHKKARLWMEKVIDDGIRSGQLKEHAVLRGEISALIIRGAFKSDDIPPFVLGYLRPI